MTRKEQIQFLLEHVLKFQIAASKFTIDWTKCPVAYYNEDHWVYYASIVDNHHTFDPFLHMSDAWIILKAMTGDLEYDERTMKFINFLDAMNDDLILVFDKNANKREPIFSLLQLSYFTPDFISTAALLACDIKREDIERE